MDSPVKHLSRVGEKNFGQRKIAPQLPHNSQVRVKKHEGENKETRIK
jgi:hypothetical protein